MTNRAGIETTPCLLCQGTVNTRLWETRDRLCYVPGRFTLVRCAGCGLLYLSLRPTPESMGAYYPANYDPFVQQTVEQLPLLQRFSVRYGLRRRCRLVLAHKTYGRLLDIGCATGQFLAEMRRFPGWQVHGVEPSQDAARFARDVLGLDVHQGELASAAYPDAHFDVVTMWDVLEHLYDPREILQEISRILKPDGVLVMRTPSLRSADARAFGPYWAGLDSPRHLAIFSHDTVAALLASSGFALRQISTGGGSFFIGLLSLRFWLEERLPDNRVRHALLRLAGSLPARLVSALPLTLLDRCGYGSSMTVVARPLDKDYTSP